MLTPAAATPQVDGYRETHRDMLHTLDRIIRSATRLRARCYLPANQTDALDRRSRTRDLRRVRLEAEDAVTYSVLASRSAGATWEEIASDLGETIEFVTEHYGDIEAHYLTHRSIDPVIGGDAGAPPPLSPVR